ncbi:cyanophycinase [Clostridium cylindrosporum]|uniref:Cyanophycinase n=1 Tax=Clostridium cylindrosporum DSM 605 TaxID=1121307 RepID=A0A0J8DF71_CLOCY|nr:cyanophycinase [Clostridium cylindrosporum]KMT22823.1 cyanophycinase CphB [Clostridium cylindrosporum DSM 605]
MEKGYLIIIGGAEDKEKECEILKEVVRIYKTKEGPLVILTAATDYPREVGDNYTSVFKSLGVDNIKVVDIQERDMASNKCNIDIINEAGCIFFTGGDQIKITSLIGGTPFYEALRSAYLDGCLIVGTSAGASCLSPTMIVAGDDDSSPRKCTIKMSPGLDIIRGVIIDQHFAQRGRIGRLLAAVAQNPEILGIGIDENTAIVIEGEDYFRVIGEGAVTVVDGNYISHTNVSELTQDEILAITDVHLHILPRGYSYGLKSKTPITKEQCKEEKHENH